MQQDILTLIEAAIRRQDSLLLQPIDTSRGAATPLYSAEGHIDSLTLVTILVDLEELVNQRLNADVRLADTSDLPEEATPFATIGTLAGYVSRRLSLIPSA